MGDFEARLSVSISDKKIRVLQLWDDYLPTFTGAAIRHNAMGIALDEAGVNVNVLTQAIEGSPLREHINGVDITRFVTKAKKRMRRQILLSIKCCRAVWQQRNDFDILHSLSVNPLYIPVLLTAKLVGKPVIVDFTLMRGNNFLFFGRILYEIGRAHV